MRWQDGLTVVGLAIGLLVLASILVYGAQRFTRRKATGPVKTLPDVQAPR